MNELALFAGAGGGILASMLCGDQTVCAVERDAYAASVLAQRQNDGTLPLFPIWSDVESFDGRPWKGIIDSVSGGFPCQDISIANPNPKGIEGERSGLWGHFARIVREIEPEVVRVENSSMLTSRGLGTVLRDLAEMGFDAEWGVLSAADLGAPHLRERLWIVASNADRVRQLQPEGRKQDIGGRTRHCASDDADFSGEGLQASREKPFRANRKQGGRLPSSSYWWATEPGMVRMVHGLAHRVDCIKALGNGQVPIVAATAWRILANE